MTERIPDFTAAGLRALTGGKSDAFPAQTTGETTIEGRDFPLSGVHRCPLGHAHCYSAACAEEAGIRASHGKPPEPGMVLCCRGWWPADRVTCGMCGRPLRAADPVLDALLEDTEPMLSAERDNREPEDR